MSAHPLLNSSDWSVGRGLRGDGTKFERGLKCFFLDVCTEKTGQKARKLDFNWGTERKSTSLVNSLAKSDILI